MAVWEPCPLNKSTNKNANSHISRGGEPKSPLPPPVFFSTHKAVLTSSLKQRCSYPCGAFCQFRVDLYSLCTFNLSLLHSYTPMFQTWCLGNHTVFKNTLCLCLSASACWPSPTWSGSYSEKWVHLFWMFHRCVTCWPHTHTDTPVHPCGKERPYRSEWAANQCSYKRAENYLSNSGGVCFKEFMFCVWNGRCRPVYTLNNLSSQSDWGIESLLV